MNESIRNSILSLIILILVFIILIPYLSSYLLEKKQIKDNEIIYQALLVEQNERLEKEYLTGKFDPMHKRGFVLIPPKYMYIEKNMYLRQEALNAFIEMHNAAILDGINLKISSATRNFDYQNTIWSKKWNGITLVDGESLPNVMPSDIEKFKKILEYSAAPTTSRHHWGTDIDINGADGAYFETGIGNREYQWLVKNASKFGYCQPYNKKGEGRINGYNEEKWHWSYLPIAKELTQKYAQIITTEDITGFGGEDYVGDLNLINDYVLSINPECL